MFSQYRSRVVLQDCGDAMRVPHVRGVSVVDGRSNTLVQSSRPGYLDDYACITVVDDKEVINIIPLKECNTMEQQRPTWKWAL